MSIVESGFQIGNYTYVAAAFIKGLKKMLDAKRILPDAIPANVLGDAIKLLKLAAEASLPGIPQDPVQTAGAYAVIGNILQHYYRRKEKSVRDAILRSHIFVLENTRWKIENPIFHNEIKILQELLDIFQKILDAGNEENANKAFR